MPDFYHDEDNRARLGQFLDDETILGYQTLGLDGHDYTYVHGVGKVMAFREYKPTKDTLEYTVYFKGPLGNHRSDFELDTSLLLEHSNEWMDGYLHGMTRLAVAEQTEWDLEQHAKRGF